MKRARLSTRVKVFWALFVLIFAFGAFVGLLLVGPGLCEDTGSPGTDSYCNGGGFEAAALTIAASVLAGIVVPATGIVLRRRLLFWLGVTAPVALVVLAVVAASTLGRR